MKGPKALSAGTPRRTIGRARLGVFAAAGAMVALAIFASTPAFAAYLPDHTLVGSFSGSGDNQLGSPYGVAIDQQTHDVYVTDFANYRVEKFDSSGNFILMFGKGVDQTTGGDVCTAASGDTCQPGTPAAAGLDPGDTPGQFSAPFSISVDNSGGPSQGDVYVGDHDPHGTVQKFDSSGHLITSWGNNGQLRGPNGTSQWAAAGSCSNCYGIDSTGVDPSGNLWVYAIGIINKFSESGRTLGSGIQNNYSVDSTTMAFDSQGHVYFSRGGIQRLGPDDYNTVYYLPSPGSTGVTVDPATDDIYVDQGNQVQHFGSYFGSHCDPTSGPCQPVETFGSPDLSNGTGIGIDATTNVVYIATSTGVSMYASLKGPDVTTGPISSYGPNTAALAGHVDPAGGGDITDCHFEYLDNQTLDHYLNFGYPAGLIIHYLGTSAPCDQSVPFSNSADVTASLSGLTPETHYSYRLVASNANGTIYGDIRTFAPHYVRRFSTDPATDIGPGGATLHGSFDPSGDDTHYYFEWGTDTSYGHTTAVPPGLDAGSVAGLQSVSADLAEQLTSSTTYHYRLVASNSLGTSYGDDATFTTAPPIPLTLESSGATNVTQSGATLTTQIRPGYADTIYNFQYGETSAYGTSTPQSDSIGNDNSSHAGSTTISGLKPGTTYHFRVVVINFRGTVHGPDQTFTTSNLPLVDSPSASAITQNGAMLSARIVPGFTPTTYHFDYGPDVSYGASTPESTSIGADGSGHLAQAALNGLAVGTTYHYRVVATNSVGVSRSADQTFTTSPSPPPPPPALRCKPGFLVRAGKCVRKAHHHRHKHRHHRTGRHG